MTAQQFFGALVRALGLYWLLDGLTRALGAFFPGPEYSWIHYVVGAALEMVIGTFVMFKADGLVEMLYAKPDEEDEEDEESEPESEKS